MDNKSCPICNREMIDGVSINDHHLIPKTFKGKESITLHKICHRMIHANISTRELKNYYHTIERLLEHEDIIKFVKWVQTKNPEFNIRVKENKK